MPWFLGSQGYCVTRTLYDEYERIGRLISIEIYSQNLNNRVAALFSPKDGNLSVFELHPRLDADTIVLGQFTLCLVLLMNDATFPWLILVPQRPDIREVFDLDSIDRHHLIEEIAVASRALSETFDADKINVAALGNVVAQLHVHVIARFHADRAWPSPVWGVCKPRPYDCGAVDDVCHRIRGRLGGSLMPAH
jgi:diadenosine tetraphosphate (Ap4A) HIT family hydrolase